MQTRRPIWDYSVSSNNEIKMKKTTTPDAPINDSGLTHLIRMGKSIRHKWVNVIAEMEIPVLPTCREPELPDNVMWTEIPGVGVSVPECIDPEYEFRRGGYDQSTVYMCDNGTLKWEPSTDQIPDCFSKLLKYTFLYC